MLDTETVTWLTVCSDRLPHLVPIWFGWDGESVLIAGKPNAKKVANLRANPAVTLALGEPDDDFDVGIVEGLAELIDEPATNVLPAAPWRSTATRWLRSASPPKSSSPPTRS